MTGRWRRSEIWKIRDVFLMIIAWVSTSSASVLVLLSESNALTCAFWRVFITTLLIYSYTVLERAVGKEGLKSVSRSNFLKAFAAGVLLGIHFLSWMESLFLVPVALSTTVVVTYPLINALAEGLMRRRLHVGEAFGLILAFLGVFTAMKPQITTNSSTAGLVLASIGALSAAGYFHLGRLSRMSGVSLTSYTVIVYASSSLTLGLYAMITGSSVSPSSATSWTYVILLALIPMLGGHTVMNYLLKKMKSYVVTSISLGEPPGATLLAAILLGQSVTMETIVGMVLVLTGITVVLHTSIRETRALES
ncbi:MAG: DMT family transporter [Zestosphaera sp.]